jgi:hypothetical protein
VFTSFRAGPSARLVTARSRFALLKARISVWAGLGYTLGLILRTSIMRSDWLIASCNAESSATSSHAVTCTWTTVGDQALQARILVLE